MTKTKALPHPYNEHRTYFYVAAMLFVSVLALYVYFLSASIVHVVMRKELNREYLEMSSKVSKLETEYIEAQHHVSESIATFEGFVVAQDKIFIDRTEDNLALSKNNDG